MFRNGVGIPHLKGPFPRLDVDFGCWSSLISISTSPQKGGCYSLSTSYGGGFMLFLWDIKESSETHSISMLQIREARWNGSESAQSYSANNKCAGFEPTSLWVINPCPLFQSTFLPLHQRALDGKGGGSYVITGKWNYSAAVLPFSKNHACV